MKAQLPAARLPFIDALKALASQLIVWHHLAFYGPMSDYVQPLFPEMISWLSQNARIAVQAFLVMGGFLAAQALARDGRLTDKPVVRLIWGRYLKLVMPYLVALLLAIGAAAVARSLMANEVTPAVPGVAQVLAHVFFLQGILGYEGLSAGVWYVAIDFQLYALLLLTLWLARHFFPGFSAAGRIGVGFLATVSLFYFNRDAAWDNWGVYFFGAYSLGALTYWGTRRGGFSPWLLAVAALAVVALWVDFRLRILVALLVAASLGVARYSGMIERWPGSKVIGWLGQISYSVFLIHFPVFLAVDALFERFVAHTPFLQMTGLVMAWVLSLVGGAALHRWVETPAHAWLTVRRKAVAAGP